MLAYLIGIYVNIDESRSAHCSYVLDRALCDVERKRSKLGFRRPALTNTSCVRIESAIMNLNQAAYLTGYF